MTAQKDSRRPWPGPASYGEIEKDFFFGRPAETAELLSQVDDEPLVVLYGRSGLGKTSLLQAGLFPKLRERNFLPVVLRLDHGSKTFDDAGYTVPGLPARTYTDQAIGWIRKGAAAAGAEAPEAPATGSTLWEYFHDGRAQFWDAGQRLVTPVLVFDQFEEFFQSGSNTDLRRQNTGRFLQELSDLIFNNPPASVRAGLESGKIPTDRFSFERVPLRVVLSLREDFLPQLDDLTKPGFPDPSKPCFPNLYRAKLRLLPLSPDAARECIELPAPDLVETPGVADRLLKSLVSVTLPICVEPAMLNIVCFRLNEVRLERENDSAPLRIPADLFGLSPEQILADFYEECWVGLSPALRVFVETELVSPKGFRDHRNLEDSRQRYGFELKDVATLVNRRLLQYRDESGGRRIELVHDRFCAPALESCRRRDAEKKERERIADEARAFEKARQAELALAEEQNRRKDAERLRAEAEEGRAEAERSRSDADRSRVDAERSRRDALKKRNLAFLVTGLAIIGFVWAYKEERAALAADQFSKHLIAGFQNALGARFLENLSDQNVLGRTGQLQMLEAVNKPILDHYDSAGAHLDSNDQAALINYSVALEQYGAALEAESVNITDALKDYSTALVQRERLATLSPGDAGRKRQVADDWDHIGDILNDEGKNGSTVDNPMDSAIGAYQAALQIQKDLIAKDQGATKDDQQELLVEYSLSEDKIGSILEANNKLDDALGYFEDALKIRDQIAEKLSNEKKENPQVQRMQYLLSTSHERLAGVYQAKGLPGSTVTEKGTAMSEDNMALQILLNLIRENRTNGSWLYDLAATYGAIGKLYELRGDLGSADPDNNDNAEGQYTLAQKYRIELAALDKDNATWQFKLATGYDHLGDVDELKGELVHANDNYGEAKKLRDKVASKPDESGARIANVQIAQAQALSLTNLGSVKEIQGDFPGALTYYDQALAIRKALADAHTASPTIKSDYAAALDDEGNIFAAQGRLSDAMAVYQLALDLRTQLASQQKAGSLPPQLVLNLAVSEDNIGDTLRDQGKVADASAHYDRARSYLERLVALNDKIFDWQNELALNCDSEGSVLVINGDLQQAMVNYKRCIGIETTLTSKETSNRQWKEEYALNLDHAGETFSQEADIAIDDATKNPLRDEAESYIDRAFTARKDLKAQFATQEESFAQMRADLASSELHQADQAADAGRFDEALGVYQQAIDLQAGLPKPPAGNVQWQEDLALSYDHQGDAYEAKSDGKTLSDKDRLHYLGEARDSHNLCIEIEEALVKMEPENPVMIGNLAKSYQDLGDILGGMGDPNGATAEYRLALARLQPLVSANAYPKNQAWNNEVIYLSGKLAPVAAAAASPSG
jgi:hypothetical protein